MQKMSLFLEAQEQWCDFLASKIKNYQKFRTFDYGPNKESAVSKLEKIIDDNTEEAA